jgi:putative restriction endonuclease
LPKRNANKPRNPFYESMREVAPGGIIFSLRDTRIAALGIARSYCYESPKPTEFGTAGSYWELIGWKIDVSFREPDNRIHPKSHIGELRGLLPEKYSPLRANGDGLQSVYLAEVGRPFAAALFRLIGGEANKVADVAKEVDRAEQLRPSREPVSDMRSALNTSTRFPRSPKPSPEAIIQARVGQRGFAPTCRASSARVGRQRCCGFRTHRARVSKSTNEI